MLEPVTIGGNTVEAGQWILPLLGAANHDPAQFAEPGRLDITRNPNAHVAFGRGIHFCLGAPLARVELATSFGTILRRLPKMELVREPEWKPGYIIRGLRELRVVA